MSKAKPGSPEFQIRETDDGSFCYDAVDESGKVLTTSALFESRADVKKAVAEAEEAQ